MSEPIGRPSEYTIDTARRICEEIATTEHGLEQICRADDMPGARTVYRWLTLHATFRQMYARAREMQAEVMAAQILAIADDGSADMVIRHREDGSEYLAVDQEHIQRSRLRVDSRKWLASKLAPRKYGDRIELANDPDNPLPAPKIIVEFMGRRPELPAAPVPIDVPRET